MQSRVRRRPAQPRPTMRPECSDKPPASPATIRPTTPSTGTMCSQRQCQGSSPKTAGRKTSARMVPIQRRIGEPPGRDRIQVQPTPPSHSGKQESRQAERLQQNVAEVGAKKADPVVGARQNRVAVFSEGSEAWYVARARKRRSETSSRTIPRNMFTGRLRVGDRTMRMGFMIRALPSPVLPGKFYRQARKQAIRPRATSIIGVRRRKSGHKGGRGNLGHQPVVWRNASHSGIWPDTNGFMRQVPA